MMSIHPFYFLLLSLLFASCILFRSRFDKVFLVLFSITFGIGVYKLLVEPIADFPLFFYIFQMFAK